MTMGLLSGNSQNDNLVDFAKEKGVSYTPVYYHSVNQLKDALKKGETDVSFGRAFERIDMEPRGQVPLRIHELRNLSFNGHFDSPTTPNAPGPP